MITDSDFETLYLVGATVTLNMFLFSLGGGHLELCISSARNSKVCDVLDV